MHSKQPATPGRFRHILTGMFIMASAVSFTGNYLMLTGRVAVGQQTQVAAVDEYADAIVAANQAYEGKR